MRSRGELKVKLRVARGHWRDYKFQFKWNKLEYVFPSNSIQKRARTVCTIIKLFKKRHTSNSLGWSFIYETD